MRHQLLVALISAFILVLASACKTRTDTDSDSKESTLQGLEEERQGFGLVDGDQVFILSVLDAFRPRKKEKMPEDAPAALREPDPLVTKPPTPPNRPEYRVYRDEKWINYRKDKKSYEEYRKYEFNKAKIEAHGRYWKDGATKNDQRKAELDFYRSERTERMAKVVLANLKFFSDMCNAVVIPHVREYFYVQPDGKEAYLKDEWKLVIERLEKGQVITPTEARTLERTLGHVALAAWITTSKVGTEKQRQGIASDVAHTLAKDINAFFYNDFAEILRKALEKQLESIKESNPQFTGHIEVILDYFGEYFEDPSKRIDILKEFFLTIMPDSKTKAVSALLSATKKSVLLEKIESLEEQFEALKKAPDENKFKEAQAEYKNALNDIYDLAIKIETGENIEDAETANMFRDFNAIVKKTPTIVLSMADAADSLADIGKKQGGFSRAADEKFKKINSFRQRNQKAIKTAEDKALNFAAEQNVYEIVGALLGAVSKGVGPIAGKLFQKIVGFFPPEIKSQMEAIKSGQKQIDPEKVAKKIKDINLANPDSKKIRKFDEVIKKAVTIVGDNKLPNFQRKKLKKQLIYNIIYEMEKAHKEIEEGYSGENPEELHAFLLERRLKTRESLSEMALDKFLSECNDGMTSNKILSMIGENKLKKFKNVDAKKIREKEVTGVAMIKDRGGYATIGTATISDAKIVFVGPEFEAMVVKFKKENLAENLKKEKEIFDRIIAKNNGDPKLGQYMPGVNTEINAYFETAARELDLKAERESMQRDFENTGYKTEANKPHIFPGGLKVEFSVVEAPANAPKIPASLNKDMLFMNLADGSAVEDKLNELRDGIDASLRELGTKSDNERKIELKAKIAEDFKALGKLSAVMNGVFERWLYITFKSGTFHGDTHSGNIFYKSNPDGSAKISFIDVGGSAKLNPLQRQGLAKMLTYFGLLGDKIKNSPDALIDSSDVDFNGFFAALNQILGVGTLDGNYDRIETDGSKLKGQELIVALASQQLYEVKASSIDIDGKKRTTGMLVTKSEYDSLSPDSQGGVTELDAFGRLKRITSTISAMEDVHLSSEVGGFFRAMETIASNVMEVLNETKQLKDRLQGSDMGLPENIAGHYDTHEEMFGAIIGEAGVWKVMTGKDMTPVGEELLYGEDRGLRDIAKRRASDVADRLIMPGLSMLTLPIVISAVEMSRRGMGLADDSEVSCLLEQKDQCYVFTYTYPALRASLKASCVDGLGGSWYEDASCSRDFAYTCKAAKGSKAAKLGAILRHNSSKLSCQSYFEATLRPSP